MNIHSGLRDLVEEMRQDYHGGGDLTDRLIEKWIKRAESILAAPPAANDAQVAEPIPDELLRMEWRIAGGNFHGPNIETVTMPEADYFKFRRSLDVTAAPAVVVDEVKELIDLTKLKTTCWPKPSATGMKVGMPVGVKLVYGDIQICVSTKRSQHKNRDIAMRALVAAVKESS